jgi:hypothetical protein
VGGGVLIGQPLNRRGDRRPARRERLHGRLRDAADLGAVAVLTLDQLEPGGLQLLLHD